MRAVLFLLSCLALCPGLDKPSLAFATTSFDYDLTATRPFLPIAWGRVSLSIPTGDGTAQVRFTARFRRDSSDNIPTTNASDRLTVRNGLGVEVTSENAFTTYAGASWLVATGKQTWTWSGPVQGGTTTANILTCASDGEVSEADVLRALRQVCYANLGGPGTLTRREIRVIVERQDGPLWTASSYATITITIAKAGSMPVQIRFEPVTVVQGGAEVPLRIADLAGTITTSTICTLAAGELPSALTLGGALCVSVPPSSGMTLRAEASASSTMSGLHACELTTQGTPLRTAFIDATVVSDPAVLTIFGNPPLAIDVTADGTTAADFQVNTPSLDLHVVSHPGLQALSAGELAAVQAAISLAGQTATTTRIAFDHARLRALIADGSPSRLLACALRFTVTGAGAGAPSRLVPCIIELHRSPGG